MWGECHAHIFMDGVDYKRAARTYAQGVDREDILRKLKIYKEAGITFVRDGGDHYGAGVLARELAADMGIDYRTPVFAIHKAGCYGSIVGRSFENLSQYRERVHEAMEQRADFIKVMFSGIMDFAGDGSVTGSALSREEIFEIVHIAHEEGLAVMAHVNGAQAIIDAIEAGTDSIEHGNFMDDESIRALCEHDTVWVPTHVTIHNLLRSSRFDHKVIRRLDELQQDAIRKAWRGGAVIALGSDAGAYGVPHGSGIRDEYDCFRTILEEDRDVDRRLLRAQLEIEHRFCHNYE